MDTLLMNILGNDTSVWGKSLNGIHRRGHPTHVIIKILLYRDHTLVNIHMKYLRNIHMKYLHTRYLFR